MNRPPNILLITSDQQRGDCYGFAGRRVRTPHLNRLAAQGTRFDACITPAPVCQPARASILTGQLPLTHGVCDNGIDLRPEVGEQGFAGQLGRAGYQTAMIGKAHFATTQTFQPTGTPECKTNSANFPPTWHGPYMGFDYVELTTQGHWHKIRQPVEPPSGQHYEHWFFETVGGVDAFEEWKSETRPGKGAAQTWNSGLPVAWHNSTWIADEVRRYLDRHDSDRPFCLWTSFPDPHHPFDCPDPWNLLHSPSEVCLPIQGEKDLERRPWWHRASLEGEPALDDPVLKRFRKQGSRTPDQSEVQLREMIANYYGMISLIDHNVGRILSALEDSGLADNTIVFYTSDHGDLLGDHGLYLKGPTFYEGLLQVGLIVRGPDVPVGKVISEPVSTLDLGATFCDLAGTKMPDAAQSRSLRPVWGASNTREAAYSEWRVHESRCGVALDLRHVRKRDAKLTMELNSGAGELYDLKSDPNEMNNLFDDPARARLRDAMTALLDRRPGAMRKEFDLAVGVA